MEIEAIRLAVFKEMLAIDGEDYLCRDTYGRAGFLARCEEVSHYVTTGRFDERVVVEVVEEPVPSEMCVIELPAELAAMIDAEALTE